MATKESPILNVLREIRDEVKANRAEIQDTNLRLGRLETGVDSLGQRQLDTEIRLATELTAVAHAVEGVKDLLRAQLSVREKVEDLERRIVTLEGRNH